MQIKSRNLVALEQSFMFSDELKEKYFPYTLEYRRDSGASHIYQKRFLLTRGNAGTFRHIWGGGSSIHGYSVLRGKIRFIEGNAKCRHLKKWPVKGLCGRCLSVWGQQPYTHPPYTCIVNVYTVYFFTQVREEGWELNQRAGRWATVHKAGSKIPSWLTVSPVYKLW
jgi:hypothetical protein